MSRSYHLSIFASAALLAALIALWFWHATSDSTATLLFISCATGIALFLAVTLRNSYRLSGKERHLEQAIQKLLLSAHAGGAQAVPGKAVSLQSLADEIERKITQLEAERNGLKAVLTAMEEGVIVVDSEKRVMVANAAARKILSIKSSDPIGAYLSELTLQPDLLTNIELSVKAAQAGSFEFQLSMPNENRVCSIMARCAPLHDESRLAGAVAVLHDISALRALERMRTDFVANVSHELRTPLTSLLGYLETLEGGWDSEEQAKQFLGICRRQAENLSRIVEDLLRLSKLENPQQDIASMEIDLAEVANIAIEQCSPLAERRKIVLSSELPGYGVLIRGERGLLVQALCNLIENAINYNRENGRVNVRLTRLNRNDASNSDSPWEIAVSDTGIGIPQNALKHVFERFYRVDKARSRDRGGTGLGLAIVKHIALAHGASVHVESEAGKGSTFFMRFKAMRQEKRPARALS